LKLSHEDWAYYESHRDEFTDETVLGPVRAYAKKYRLPPQFQKLSLAPVFDDREKLERFYSLALVRDRALFENAVRQVKESKEGVAAVVTGGFHTQGLTRQLRDKGISFVVISPKITKEVDDTLYLEILTGKRTPLDDLKEEEERQQREKSGTAPRKTE
ncbi:MAG: hypothetical protein ACRD2L_20495, partial [Terriglobia bacterium]